jgi:hypothetical protein
MFTPAQKMGLWWLLCSCKHVPYLNPLTMA